MFDAMSLDEVLRIAEFTSRCIVGGALLIFLLFVAKSLHAIVQMQKDDASLFRESRSSTYHSSPPAMNSVDKTTIKNDPLEELRLIQERIAKYK